MINWLEILDANHQGGCSSSKKEAQRKKASHFEGTQAPRGSSHAYSEGKQTSLLVTSVINNKRRRRE